MGKTLQYVKEFTFAKGGAVGAIHDDIAQDKAMIKAAVHKHEKAQHKGTPLTKLKKGGSVKPSREAMIKREALETPTMRRDEVVQRSTRKGVPVAPMSPLLALKCGGSVKNR